MQIKSHTFLITGAASGLGAATAERLVAGGGRVVLCDLSDAVQAHAERLGDTATAIRADVTSGEDVKAAIDAAMTLADGRELAGVVHCAGVVSVAKLVRGQSRRPRGLCPHRTGRSVRSM